MRQLYIDCKTGVAGDMLSAALLGLCPNREAMLEQLNGLGIPGVVFRAETIRRYGVTGIRMTVKYHDMEEEQGLQQEEHSFSHHRHHNGFQDAVRIIDLLNMPEKAKTDAKAVYKLIAEAESLVHGCDMEHIHFHELGTMDAVADISAACLMINQIGIERISASPICTGYGKIKCAHGILPVPAPATAQLLRDIPNFAGDVEGELSTPTGTAIVKHFAQSFGQMPESTVQTLAYGIGKKDFGCLSAVKLVLGEP